MAGTTVVLVPGGFTGAWMWADAAALLEREHIDVVTLELPTIGPDSAGADFYADVRAVREALDRLDPPVVLCGHSYAGAVITEAAAGPPPHPAVRHLVYLTAAVPDAGDSLASLMTATAAGTDDAQEGVTFREDGFAELDREQARRALFNDCSPERAEAGLNRLRPGTITGGTQPLTGAAWRHLPATYVRGTEDVMPEAIAPAFFEHNPELVELPAGHCPHWSHPDLVAQLLADRARAVCR